MTPEQAEHLATLLRERREKLGLTTYEVGRRARTARATVWRIEQGQSSSPKFESLQAIGDVLGIPVSDLFAAIGWVPAKELPSIRPYLRSKYGSLPADARAEIEAEFDAIAKKHGISFDQSAGPARGEDE